MADGTTLTPAIQEYLESLYWLGEAGIERTPTNLARAMQVSPPSVTGMVRRLEGEGLVDRGPGKRIVLTAKGMEVAKHVVSRHRLVEAFLVKIMGVPWDEVHEEAEAFEMGVTPALEARMLEMIGEARTCPHGHPIGDYPREPGRAPDRRPHRQRRPDPPVRERGPRPAADVPPGRGRAKGQLHHRRLRRRPGQAGGPAGAVRAAPVRGPDDLGGGRAPGDGPPAEQDPESLATAYLLGETHWSR
jgi:Mn-dependent DtxR family transcriptional regulator